jgi:hypothetical protein
VYLVLAADISCPQMAQSHQSPVLSLSRDQFHLLHGIRNGRVIQNNQINDDGDQIRDSQIQTGLSTDFGYIFHFSFLVKLERELFLL